MGPGTAGRRPAGGASLLPRMTPQGKDSAIRADGTGRQGTPTSGRHSWPQASGRRIAAPPHDAARQRHRHSCRWPPQGTPTSGRHSWPQASGRRIAAPPHDAARQRHRHSCRWHRPPGNADLRSAQLAAGQRAAHRCIRADDPGRQGTPTSGRHNWPQASGRPRHDAARQRHRHSCAAARERRPPVGTAGRTAGGNRCSPG